jgi:hypothetical protein
MNAAARAGIGPLPAVLFARAQLALVVIDLTTSEENETLKVRPEVAIIAETHTSRWRTRGAVVEAVKHLANFVYGASMCSERSADAEYIECSIAGGERKIVGAVDGTLVVIGNSDNAVRSCLEVRHGVRPSIHTDTELVKVRSHVESNNTLGFGYISPANSAKLFSWAAPLLMRQAPGNQQLEQLLAVSAGQGAAWCRLDREPIAAWNLKIGFSSRSSPVSSRVCSPRLRLRNETENFWKLVPEGFRVVDDLSQQSAGDRLELARQAVSYKLDAVPACCLARYCNRVLRFTD